MRNFLLRTLLVVPAVLLTPAALLATSYAVTVNTASVAGQNGYIDFQLNPGGQNSLALTSVVTSFTPAGALNSSDPNNGSFGDVTGSLPGPLTIKNTMQDNEFLEALKFGTSITFDLSLTGPALSNPNNNPAANGNTFAINLYDSTSYNNLLAPGAVGTVDVDFDGGVVTTSAFDANGNPLVTFSPVTSSAVPEPSALIPVVTVLAVAMLRRRGCKLRNELFRGE